MKPIYLLCAVLISFFAIQSFAADLAQNTRKPHQKPIIQDEEQADQTPAAESPIGGYAGGMLGVAIPSGSNTDGTSARLGFGGDAGIKVTDFELGAYVMYNSGGIQDTTASFSTTFYGLEASYFHESGFNIGVRGGLTSVSQSTGGGSLSTSPFSVGPRIGFEGRLPKAPVALGIEYNPIFVFSGTNGTVHNQDFQVHNAYVTIRVYF